ncbi:uncharacterized protein LOC111089496, partial [Limulus polyphemus]|uniref:Uncharacterized protein LOC111089496 n=1 Tax=Limulus polyphemus TaxID=6850 RepID=A0ABM1TPM0_LIMPO
MRKLGGYPKWERNLSCPSSPEYPTRSPELYCSRGQKGHSRPTALHSDDSVFYSDFKNGHLNKKCVSVELADLSKTENFSDSLYQCQYMTLTQRLKQFPSYPTPGLLTIPVEKQQEFIPSPPSGENVELLSDWANNLVKEIDETLSCSDHEETSVLISSPVRNLCNECDSCSSRKKTTHNDGIYTNVARGREPWYCKYRAKYNFRNRCLGKSRLIRQNSYPSKVEEVDTLQSRSTTRRSSCPSRKPYSPVDSKLTWETAIQTSDDDYLIPRTGGGTIPNDHSSQKLRTEISVPACLENCESPVNKFPSISNRNGHSDLTPKLPVQTILTKNELDHEHQTHVYSKLGEANDKHSFLQSVSEVVDVRNTKGVDIQSQADSDLEAYPVYKGDLVIVASQEHMNEDNRTNIYRNSLPLSTMTKAPMMRRRSNCEIETIQDLTLLVKQRSKSDTDVPQKRNTDLIVPKSETKVIYDETVISYRNNTFGNTNFKAVSCSEFGHGFLVAYSKNQTNYDIELVRKRISSDDDKLSLGKLSSTDSWKSAEQEPAEDDSLTFADVISSSDETAPQSQLLDVLEDKEALSETKISCNDDDVSRILERNFSQTNKNEKSADFTEIRNDGNKRLHEEDMTKKMSSEFLHGHCRTNGQKSSEFATYSEQTPTGNGKVNEKTPEPTCFSSHVAADHSGSSSTVSSQLSRHDLEDFMRKVEDCAYQPPPNGQLGYHTDSVSENGTSGRELQAQDAITQTTPHTSRSSSYTRITDCDLTGSGSLSQTQEDSNLSKESSLSLSSSSISEVLSNTSTSSPIKSTEGDSDEAPGTDYFKFEKHVGSSSSFTLSEYSSQSEDEIDCRLCNLTDQSTTGPSAAEKRNLTDQSPTGPAAAKEQNLTDQSTTGPSAAEKQKFTSDQSTTGSSAAEERNLTDQSTTGPSAAEKRNLTDQSTTGPAAAEEQNLTDQSTSGPAVAEEQNFTSDQSTTGPAAAKEQNFTDQSTSGPAVAKKDELCVLHSKIHHTFVFPRKIHSGSEVQSKTVRTIDDSNECYKTSSHGTTKYTDIVEIRPSSCVQTLPKLTGKTYSNGYQSERTTKRTQSEANKRDYTSPRVKLFLREMNFKSSSAPLLRLQPHALKTNSTDAPDDVTCVATAEENKVFNPPRSQSVKELS